MSTRVGRVRQVNVDDHAFATFATDMSNALHLLPGSKGVDQTATRCAVVTGAGSHGRAVIVTGRVAMARQNVSRCSPKDCLDICRRKAGVLFKEQCTHSGDLRRCRRGATEHTPAI